jgi:hypothetical protein
MRPTSILLAIVVVLGFVREAGAQQDIGVPVHSYTVSLGGRPFGLIEYNNDPRTQQQGEPTYTVLCFGTLGSRRVPFTATQGLVGFCVIVVGVVALVTVGTVRWRRKPSA